VLKNARFSLSALPFTFNTPAKRWLPSLSSLLLVRGGDQRAAVGGQAAALPARQSRDSEAAAHAGSVKQEGEQAVIYP
jgi:hypothetical protein